VYPTGSVNQQITEGVASIYDTDSNKKLLSELRTAANTTFAAQTIRTIEEI
jgi:hypothetical protein